MLGAACRDIGVHSHGEHAQHVFLREVPGVHAHLVRCPPAVVGGLVEHRYRVLDVGWLVGDRLSNDHLAFLIHDDLRVVCLHESAVATDHDATLGVGEVALRLGRRRPLLVTGNAVRRQRSATSAGARRRAAFGIGLLLVLIAGCLRFRLQLSFGLSNALEAALRAGKLLRQLVAALVWSVLGVFPRVGFFGFRQELGNPPRQRLLLLLHSRVAHRLVLGGVGLHLGAIQRHVTELDHAGLLAELQHLQEQPAKRLEMHSPKLADTDVVGVRAARNHVERHVLVGAPLDLPR
ncbi:MAG: hypothetical protein BWZ09_02626 [Alphaproteobacteria bacterium ADurb.BinA305]|nr:MAG: hypothetical protein BWZ09_02626 [Alphaproteobacteria bacterium ADurb.BinA305]